MDEQAMRDILSGRQRTAGAVLVRTALWPAGKLYALAMRLRRASFRGGLGGARPEGANAIISIGNITTGGTGKTPMVEYVVRRLSAAGHAVAVLTRGYKAAGGVSDEARMLHESTGVPVVVNADRVAGARAALAGGANVLVLDDGFQHLRLRRDLDIVLIDATNPFGYGQCLPRGLLREPLSALRDADVLVITRSDMVAAAEADAIQARLARVAPRATIFRAAHQPTVLVDSVGRRMPAVLDGRRVFAFCGLGNPDSFFAALERAGATLVGRDALSDHAEYPPEQLARIAAAAKASSADMLVTTAKDRVKIVDPAALGMPLWTLLVAMGLGAEAKHFDQLILDTAKASAERDGNA